MTDCVFCKIARHEIEASDIFYEDDRVLVMLDEDWAVKGHSLVIWKKHHLNASDLTTEEFLHFSSVFRNAEKAVLEITGKKRALTLKTGGLVSHFHFHIYPVDSDTSWETIKDIFEKKMKHSPDAEEKGLLLQSLYTALKS
jgi:histidine triad (HIT) family protein